ncbi:23S rRNA (adenine(2030)-N(6))-methyltransferase RlmJ [Oleiagrimonas citrea]|uniref:Ribosomal RNA large subunit methyltransferase J n=1 Tax=Oleiagrimonas citrea TaxID=1665687 RepID=A0A846ZJW3_9GAMM|nr:23S rRNA (adenine(2030)-N(6))-methyltransferase RlmJ [Oleiagrimonas citrea]NKZ37849.1 23S rRNA (adenine(2030)-N(6))-methyltransferase RlmJ [Oleiagrimonas citrea]
MNYRHAYHAGNFADVLKHCVLIALIEALQAKPKPLCYLDTHAGAGRYDLSGEAARKTAEADAGIGRLRALHGRLPLLDRYLDLVAAEGADHYPGSPRIAARLLRADDAAQLCELLPEEAAKLRALFREDRRIHVHERDGYAAMKALLPPTQKRGLVLIDPPFEEQIDEYARIQTALDTALTRWPSGVYAVWYPIKLGRELHPFRRWLRGCAAKTVLDIELLTRPDTVPQRLNGAGIAVLNPPWRLDATLHPLLRLLATQLAADGERGTARLNWLKTEDGTAA